MTAELGRVEWNKHYLTSGDKMAAWGDSGLFPRFAVFWNI
jgi:hypothetical protein